MYGLVNKRIRGIHILFFQNKLKLFLSKNLRAIVRSNKTNKLLKLQSRFENSVLPG